MTSPQTHVPGSPGGEPVAPDPTAQDGLQSSLITLGRTFISLDSALSDPAAAPTSRAGLGLTGALTLVVVAMTGPARPSAIAQVTGLSTGGVTLLLDRLERAGLLERAYGIDPDDRRAVIASVTDAGRRTLGELDDVVIAHSSDLAADLRSLQLEATSSIPAQRQPAGATEPSTDHSAPSGAAPPMALMTLFALVNVFDVAILQVVGEEGPISVTDPRPITLFFQLYRDGELWLKDIPALIGRSRGTVHSLLRQMEAAGLTERFRSSAENRSGVRVRLTVAGGELVRALLRSLHGQLPALMVPIDNFVGSLPADRLVQERDS